MCSLEKCAYHWMGYLNPEDLMNVSMISRRLYQVSRLDVFWARHRDALLTWAPFLSTFFEAREKRFSQKRQRHDAIELDCSTTSKPHARPGGIWATFMDLTTYDLQAFVNAKEYSERRFRRYKRVFAAIALSHFDHPTWSLDESWFDVRNYRLDLLCGQFRYPREFCVGSTRFFVRIPTNWARGTAEFGQMPTEFVDHWISILKTGAIPSKQTDMGWCIEAHVSKTFGQW